MLFRSGAAAAPSRAARGMIIGDRGGRDDEGRGAVIVDAAAEAVAAVAPGSSSAAHGLVAAEGAAGNGQSRPKQIVDAATQPIAAALASASRRSNSLIAAERAAGDRGYGPAEVLEPTTHTVAREDSGRVAGAADGLVVGKGAIADGQGVWSEAEGITDDRTTVAHTDQKGTGAAGVSAASQGFIVVERAIRDRRRATERRHGAATTATDIAEAAAVARIIGAANGLIIPERTSGHDQQPPFIVGDGTAGTDGQEVRSHVLAGAVVVATDRLVADESAVLDREGRLTVVMDSTAEGYTRDVMTFGTDLAASADHSVAYEGGADNRSGGCFTTIPDGPALGVLCLWLGDGLVAGE